VTAGDTEHLTREGTPMFITSIPPLVRTVIGALVLLAAATAIGVALRSAEAPLTAGAVDGADELQDAPAREDVALHVDRGAPADALPAADPNRHPDPEPADLTDLPPATADLGGHATDGGPAAEPHPEPEDPGPDGTVLTEFTPDPEDVGEEPEPGVGGPGDLAGHGGPRTAGHSASDELKAGAGCAVQCITRGVAYARGVGAKLVVRTDTPAAIWMVVHGPGSTQVLESDGLTTAFDALLDDLEGGTTYAVTVAATDAEGRTAHAHGEFDTLRRFARVHFDAIQVTEHPYPGPLRAHYWVDGDWRHGLMQEVEPRTGRPPAAIVPAPAQGVVIVDAAETVSAMAQVVDRGGTKKGFDSCGDATAPADPAWDGLEECAAWSNAWQPSIPITDHPHLGLREEHTFPPVAMFGHTPGGVKFSTSATVSVWYDH
jgi:hypothetical protein